MRYNPARQEIVLKVVYYGPGLAGKTTNLQFLHDRVPAGRASELVSVDTHSERTIQFDFLAVELGKVQGMDVRLDFYTVPGQSYYAATRRQVLTAADGVVFVADSRREALDENIDAMNEMLNNLRHHGLPDDLPIIVQYNKQDLPTAVPFEQLQPLLNVRGWPSFPAAAINGEGVAETCEALARMLADRLAHSELPVVLTSLPQVAAGPQSQQPAQIRTPAPEAPKSWLITCHRCQSMLDVPSAVVGEVYTCGVCHSQLEVVDPDRGSTRPPVPAARPITAQHQRSRPSANVDVDLYQEADIGSGGHALKPPTSSHSASRAGYIAPAGAFPLDGFTVIGVLDENAQGRRLRVRETATGKTFRALVLSQSLLAQPGYREAVEPYARMTGPLRHPNLLHMASLRQAGEEMVFLSADPQDHEPLSHVLARRRALAPPHAIGILRQLVLALEEAARHGAIHGWLRPDAILISAEGSVLVDEICVPPNHRFITRELAGVSAATEYYLAPEYLNDDLRGDIRADIFVLGALLFRMITGDGLVTGYNAMEALHKLSANGPRMLRDAQQGISRELNGFYLKLVAVDRSQRYQTYREVIDALDRFGGGARRQNLQLTGQQPRPPSGGVRPPTGPGTGQLGRRGGTGPLPPAPRARTGRTTDPSGASPVLPPPIRRRKSSSTPVVLAVVVVLMMAVAVIAVLMMRPVPLPQVPETAAPVPVPRPVATTSTTAAPVKPMDANQERLEIRRTFADQMVADQFAAALKTTERFRDPLDRREAESQLVARHDGRKQDIEALLKPGIDPQAVRKALEPFRGGQRLPGDLEWAMAVQSRADALAIDAQGAKPEAEAGVKPADGGDWGPTRPAALVPVPVAPGPDAVNDPMAGTLVSEQGGPQARPAPPKPEIPPAVDAGAAAFGVVVRALAANQPAQAQAAVVALPVDDRSAPALKQLVDWWPARVQLINRVAGAHAVKLRFNHPTTGELVDVTSADAAGVSVAAANGSGSSLTWGQLPPKVQAKLFVDASGAAGAPAEELGGAIAVELVADDPAMAGVIGKRGKATLADKAAVVDTLLELYGRRAAVAVLNKGFDAARAGTSKGAVDALAEVRKLDKSWTKGLEAEIARLEAASTEPAAQAAAPAAGATPATTGDLPKDLRERQAALRTLGWEPVGDAWLEGTAVRLTPNSGISFEMTKGVTGFLVSASGDGYLRLIPSRGIPGAGVKGGVPLPLSPDHVSNYTVTFSRDAMTVLDGRGGVVQSVPLQTAPTLFLVISTADATLSTVPKPTLQ